MKEERREEGKEGGVGEGAREKERMGRKVGLRKRGEMGSSSKERRRERGERRESWVE